MSDLPPLPKQYHAFLSSDFKESHGLKYPPTLRQTMGDHFRLTIDPNTKEHVITIPSGRELSRDELNKVHDAIKGHRIDGHPTSAIAKHEKYLTSELGGKPVRLYPTKDKSLHYAIDSKDNGYSIYVPIDFLGKTPQHHARRTKLLEDLHYRKDLDRGHELTAQKEKPIAQTTAPQESAPQEIKTLQQLADSYPNKTVIHELPPGHPQQPGHKMENGVLHMYVPFGTEPDKIKPSLDKIHEDISRLKEKERKRPKKEKLEIHPLEETLARSLRMPVKVNVGDDYKVIKDDKGGLEVTVPKGPVDHKRLRAALSTFLESLNSGGTSKNPNRVETPNTGAILPIQGQVATQKQESGPTQETKTKKQLIETPTEYPKTTKYLKDKLGISGDIKVTKYKGTKVKVTYDSKTKQLHVAFPEDPTHRTDSKDLLKLIHDTIAREDARSKTKVRDEMRGNRNRYVISKVEGDKEEGLPVAKEDKRRRPKDEIVDAEIVPQKATAPQKSTAPQDVAPQEEERRDIIRGPWADKEVTLAQKPHYRIKPGQSSLGIDRVYLRRGKGKEIGHTILNDGSLELTVPNGATREDVTGYLGDMEKRAKEDRPIPKFLLKSIQRKLPGFNGTMISDIGKAVMGDKEKDEVAGLQQGKRNFNIQKAYLNHLGHMFLKKHYSHLL